MSRPYALSLSPRRSGETLIDVNTPLAFIIGFTAGVWGIDPSMSMLTFVAAKIVHESLATDPKSALFKRGRGESLSNELGDVLANFAGVQLGVLTRGRLQQPATQQPAPQQPAQPVQGLALGRGILQ